MDHLIVFLSLVFQTATSNDKQTLCVNSTPRVPLFRVFILQKQKDEELLRYATLLTAVTPFVQRDLFGLPVQLVEVGE